MDYYSFPIECPKCSELQSFFKIWFNQESDLIFQGTCGCGYEFKHFARWEEFMELCAQNDANEDKKKFLQKKSKKGGNGA